MKKFKENYKFLMCSHDELIEKGWEIKRGEYFHDDFPGNVICRKMLDYDGKTLTVKNEWGISDWYRIKEDYSWSWPVATFSSADNLILLSGMNLNSPQQQCIEGMTELDGWFICKICGDNLREIK